MCNCTVFVFLCLFVIGNLEKVRTESYNQELDCLENLRDNNRYNIASYKLCKLLDRETDPCDDFYRFACGKYIDSKNGSGNDDNSIQLDVEQRNKRFLINFLKHSNHKRNVYQFDVYLAIDFYKSCMNRDKQDLQTMAKLIGSYGGWPAVIGHKWYTKSNLVMFKINEDFDIAPILSIKYLPTYQNFAETFALSLPTFFMSRNQLVGNTDLYFELMVEVAVAFGARRSFAEIEMRKVLEFELDLINNYQQPSESYSLTLIEMQTQYPEVLKFIVVIINSYVTIYDDLKLTLFPMKYFISLESRLAKTSEQTITNYIIWRAILSSSQFLEANFVRRVERYVYAVARIPAKKSTPYDQVCFDYLKTLLPLSLNTIYTEAQSLLSDNKKAAINKIKFKIRNEIIKMIEESKWMDDGAKIQLIEKLKAMYIWIWNRNRYNELRGLFEFNLKIVSDNFLHNILQIKKYHRIHPQVLLTHHLVPTWQTNAYYAVNDNSVFVPAGILHYPFFEVDAPSYFNYGALGSSIGHEIGHAFDDRSYAYDKHGELIEWLSVTENNYEHITECFKRQYSEMETENGLKLNGSNTINEDICDNLGVKAAYKVFRSVTANDELPGLWNYTHRQLFWISMAQSYCGFTKPSYYETLLQTDEHTLRQYRILGIIRNIPDFAQDFNCHPDSKMYSKINERCEFL